MIAEENLRLRKRKREYRNQKLSQKWTRKSKIEKIRKKGRKKIREETHNNNKVHRIKKEAQ